MNLFEAITLGLTQGVTEFIPVSSSGHLEIIQRLLGAGGRAADFHFFLELINFGTLLALIIYYRRRLLRLFQDIFFKKDFKMAINLLITSIPAGLIGFLLSQFIADQPFFSSIYTIAIAMGLVGLLMVFVDRLPHLPALQSEHQLTKTRALAIGLAQTFALIPGVSRSGSTILAGRIVGLNSEHAANYSFTASIPIMIGVCLKSVISGSSRAYFLANPGLLLFSNLIAFLSGLLALRVVMKFFAKPQSLPAFGYYRLCLASIILTVVLFI
ncbi:MAG: undecaprenyl-diphosphate phosphatase [Candidatus Saccharibacteria bacterium]|nr:undecaprenyl-diphosphate phosphatase [Candidatus Saccharibacteria bacterium]